MMEECANPLLLQWIKEWLDQARERNSKGVLVYKKAYDSMKSCPLRFDHPSEAQQLSGLGPKLCDRLTDKLKAYCDANGLPMPEKRRKRGKQQLEGEDEADSPRKKKARKVKPYVPALRSGAYALVLSLATIDRNTSQGLTKPQAIELAQPHCDSSFTAPSDPTKFYTAWNSMKTLIDKDLVHERGRPTRRYMLTDDGWEVADRIKSIGNGSTLSFDAGNKLNVVPQTRMTTSRPAEMSRLSESRIVPGRAKSIDIEEILSNQDNNITGQRDGHAFQRENSSGNYEIGEGYFAEFPPSFTPILIPARSFTVNLVLDTREIRTTTDRDYISSELLKRGVNLITRALPLGDALWVAKLNPAMEELLIRENVSDEDDGCTEIILDHIVERKRLDDLIGSIKDGRFHEQKFRLRRSGIKNIIYIIEDFSISTENGDRYGEAVDSAIASTQVVNEYFAKRTEKLDDTIRYLATMTKMLQAMYESRPLHLIPSRVLDCKTHLRLMTHLRESQPTKAHYITFSAFSSLCSKSETMSLRDVYLKMLMCSKGITGDKAIEIQRRWKTPRHFMDAYEATKDQKGKDSMVSDKLSSLIPRKKVTKGLSCKVAEVWA